MTIKKYFKLLIGLSVAAVFILACDPVQKSQKKSQTPSQDSQEKVGTDEIQQLSPEKKHLKKIITLLIQADQVYSESWGIMFGQSQGLLQSAFKTMYSKLQLHLGQGNNVLLTTGQCPTNYQILKYSSMTNPDFIDIVSKQFDCKTNQEKEVMTIRIDFRFKTYQITAWPNMIPQGVGESLALLNRRINCLMSSTEKDVLSKIKCDNLGQNLSRSNHVQFKNFEFQKEKSEMLTVEADQYTDLMNKVICERSRKRNESCMILKVPLNGRIKYTEDRRIKDLETADSKKMNPKNEAVKAVLESELDPTKMTMLSINNDEQPDQQQIQETRVEALELGDNNTEAVKCRVNADGIAIDEQGQPLDTIPGVCVDAQYPEYKDGKVITPPQKDATKSSNSQPVADSSASIKDCGGINDIEKRNKCEEENRLIEASQTEYGVDPRYIAP